MRKAQRYGFPGFRRGPIRFSTGKIVDRELEKTVGAIKNGEDPMTVHLTGAGTAHRVDNATIDTDRLPPNYEDGDLAENVLQRLHEF